MNLYEQFEQFALNNLQKKKYVRKLYKSNAHINVAVVHKILFKETSLG